MLELYYWTTPNGHKLTMFFEESGLEYVMKPVDISKGEQFKPEFLKIAPNNRIPALVDTHPKALINRSTFLSLVPSCCIWLKNQGSLFQMICLDVWNV